MAAKACTLGSGRAKEPSRWCWALRCWSRPPVRLRLHGPAAGWCTGDRAGSCRAHDPWQHHGQGQREGPRTLGALSGTCQRPVPGPARSLCTPGDSGTHPLWGGTWGPPASPAAGMQVQLESSREAPPDSKPQTAPRQAVPSPQPTTIQPQIQLVINYYGRKNSPGQDAEPPLGFFSTVPVAA